LPPSRKRPSSAIVTCGCPNASIGEAESRKARRLTDEFQKSCSCARACGVAGVWISVASPTFEWSTQRASAGR